MFEHMLRFMAQGLSAVPSSLKTAAAGIPPAEICEIWGIWGMHSAVAAVTGPEGAHSIVLTVWEVMYCSSLAY